MGEEAAGIQEHPDYKLGAAIGPNTWDKRTVNLANFVNKDIQIPQSWDFDHGRARFIPHMWGNDEYGDCECAARANLLLRLERKETRGTPKITDTDVVEEYCLMTGCKSPGDNNDTGLTTLDNLRKWRHGWEITKKWKAGETPTTRKYTIEAYGYINPRLGHLARLSTYLFSGLIMGLNMPVTAQEQTDKGGPWEVVPNAGPRAEPGSWGGHAVLCKRYDAGNLYVLTWGMEIRVTNEWINTYAEEAYAVIDSLDTWNKYPDVFDVQKMITTMQQAGIHVQT